MKWIACSAVATVNLVAALVCLPAAAQESGEAAPAAIAADGNAPAATAPTERPGGNRLIEEIIVTSQKREENLQDVPISVQAFTADKLDAQGVVTTKDLQLITPGLQYDEVASFSVIFLRGVGTDVFLPTADGSVATYIDGIYFPFANSLAQDLGALERIEVLKGPQGTLFGRNSTGGAISIITRAPTKTDTFSAQYSYGSFNETKLRLFMSGPVADSLLASASIIHNTGDSFYEFTDDSPVQNIIKNRNTGVQAKLLWQIGDGLDATVAGTRVQLQGAGTSLFVQSEPKPLGTLVGQTADSGDPFKVALSAEPFNYTNNSVGSLTVNYRPSPFDVKLLTSYQSIETDSQNDYDAGKQDLVTFRSSNLFADVFTGELQLISNDAGWHADRLKWIAGAYFIKSRGGFDPVDVVVSNRTIPNPNLLPGLGLTQPFIDAFNALIDPVNATLPNIAGLPLPPTPAGVPEGVAVRISAFVDTKSPSVFFQSTYDFTDWLALTVGGRYQTEKRVMVQSKAGLATTDGGQMPLFDYPRTQEKSSNFSPKLTLDIKPNEHSLIYVTAAKGFKSGTYNSVNIQSAPQFVQPEEVTSYELGTKTDLFDGRVRLNAAVFQNEIKDLQVQFVSIFSGGIVSLENADSATIRGADFDLIWSITDAFVLTAGGAYLDGEFDAYPNGRGFDAATGFYTEGLDFTGNTTPRTPEFTGNFGLNYQLQLEGGPLELAADTYYNSGFYYDNQNAVDERAYQIVNARISYLHAAWNLRTTVFGSNLGDEVYRRYRLVTDFGVGDTLAPPRTFGIRFNWEF